MSHDAAPIPAHSPALTAIPGPIAEQLRLQSMDALRGVALLGIFVVNVQLFAMPFGEFVAPRLGADAPLSEVIVWFVTKALFEYKFISLFSLLFGAGMVMQMTRAAARGDRFIPLYLRRLAILAMIGLAHGFLLWYGDILLLYACIGPLLLLVRSWKPRTLLLAAAVIEMTMVAFMLLATVLAIVFADWIGDMGSWGAPKDPAAQVVVIEGEADDARSIADSAAVDAAHASPQQPVVVTEPPASASDGPKWLAAMIESGFDVSSERWRQAETEAFKHGPFGAALGFRGAIYVLSLLVAPFGYGWRVLAMFLAGAAFMRLGLFTSAGRKWHWRLLAIGLIVGLPCDLTGAVFAYAAITAERVEYHALSSLLHEVGSLALCLGMLGGVCLLSATNLGQQLLAGPRAVGRMALSNYLLQTLVMTYLMSWWGLAWFGGVSRPGQLALVAAIYLAQLGLSVAWLRWFTIGPLEWLWRSLTYFRRQPLRRKVATSA